MKLIDKILQDTFLKTCSIVVEITSLPVLDDEDEYNRRLNVCKGCEKLNKLNICDECWCYMPAKAVLVENSCPLGKH